MVGVGYSEENLYQQVIMRIMIWKYIRSDLLQFGCNVGRASHDRLCSRPQEIFYHTQHLAHWSVCEWMVIISKREGKVEVCPVAEYRTTSKRAQAFPSLFGFGEIKEIVMHTGILWEEKKKKKIASESGQQSRSCLNFWKDGFNWEKKKKIKKKNGL